PMTAVPTAAGRVLRRSRTAAPRRLPSVRVRSRCGSPARRWPRSRHREGCVPDDGGRNEVRRRFRLAVTLRDPPLISASRRGGSLKLTAWLLHCTNLLPRSDDVASPFEDFGEFRSVGHYSLKPRPPRSYSSSVVPSSFPSTFPPSYPAR